MTIQNKAVALILVCLLCVGIIAAVVLLVDIIFL
jgi:hypothetical protein